MSIRTNQNGFSINAALLLYPVAEGITIGRGDPVKFVSDTGAETLSVSNQIGMDEQVDGVARTPGDYGDEISVYVFKYRNSYGDLKGVFHSIMGYFTHGELKTKYLKNWVYNTYATLEQYTYGSMEKWTYDQIRNTRLS